MFHSETFRCINIIYSSNINSILFSVHSDKKFKCPSVAREIPVSDQYNISISVFRFYKRVNDPCISYRRINGMKYLINPRNTATWNTPIKLFSIVMGILFVAVIGMLFIRDSAIETNFTAKTTYVGLVLTNVKDDANFCQAHYDSLMNIKDDLNLEIICKQGIPEDEACFNAMKELIEEGCGIIIAPSFGYREYVERIAGLYPGVFFIHPMGSEYQSNIQTCMGRMYQARYLAGIVAGMRTATGQLGYVAAFEIPEVICQINAFALGARSVSPDATVHVSWCNSWVDDDAAGKASEELLNRYSDIDVLTMHTNSLMPDHVAAEKGIWSIGFNKDNVALFPDSYLTACVWKWDEYYRKVITSCLQGKFYGHHELIDMEDGIVGLSDLTENCAPGTKEALAEAVRLFDSRSFDVFYGPVTDNGGVLKVPKGESMSDEMLYALDWYVEGVSVEE